MCINSPIRMPQLNPNPDSGPKKTFRFDVVIAIIVVVGCNIIIDLHVRYTKFHFIFQDLIVVCVRGVFSVIISDSLLPARKSKRASS